MIKSYVISLEKEYERRDHIVKQFAQHDTEFQFLNAVTPDTTFEEIQTLGLMDLNFESLTAGELACLLSHLKLWHLAVEENYDYIAIFEDDIHLGSDFNKLMNDSSWLKDLDIVKLEKFRPTVELSFNSIKIEGTNRKLHILKGKNLGTGGYILSLKGANYLIRYFKRLGYVEAIDAVLFNERKYPKDLPIYQLQPAVVIQDSKLNEQSVGLTSSLTGYRRQHKNRETNKPTLGYKINRELVRFRRSFDKRKSRFQ
ncbi:glycosyltransferase family 25 protein [Psychrobacter sanguinis]|uniref:glycosyltransferase family 25 protein n=1 Tax=Psychrobacter sanguinis TaxID=861445 RepID=UPI00020C75A0|nr:glycosyltransferase family 25 protein [Psychrobacter sanguinis]EGK15180.1 lipooligosaccharide biosynthesis protein LpsA [Psychrobacter sp. 1501(2011)]MCD9151269.1 glycosyltransferase family 25 protein [Psychrobacter sanguinis]